MLVLGQAYQYDPAIRIASRRRRNEPSTSRPAYRTVSSSASADIDASPPMSFVGASSMASGRAPNGMRLTRLSRVQSPPHFGAPETSPGQATLCPLASLGLTVPAPARPGWCL
jgi:hypothetical protein